MLHVLISSFLWRKFLSNTNHFFFVQLIDGSSIACLFKEQVKCLHAVNVKRESNSELFTDTLIRIFALCKNLIELDVGGTGVNSLLSMSSQPLHTCFSSSLAYLCVKVANFDDCLCLLDGRLDKLTAFSVKINSIGETRSSVNNTVSDE